MMTGIKVTPPPPHKFDPHIPQIQGLPIWIHGHSWADDVQAWHTAGMHWSQLLDHYTTGTISNLAVAGDTMETTATRVLGNGAQKYPANQAGKNLEIVMDILNSAVAPVTPVGTQESSIASMLSAAEAIIAHVLSTHYDNLDASIVATGVWTSQTIADAVGGNWRYAAASGAYVEFTVPAGVVNKPVWMKTITQRATMNPNYTLAKNGNVVKTNEWNTSEVPAPAEGAGYHSSVLYAGVCNAGDVIRLTKTAATQVLFFDGAYVGSAKNHVCFVLEPKVIESVTYPFFNNPERIAAHQGAVVGLVAAINALLPDSCSTIDLNEANGWDPASMLYTIDTVHPNDRGMAWIWENLSSALRETIPWTPRLHVL